MFAPMGALILAIWLIQLPLGYIEALVLGPLSGGIMGCAVVSFMGTLRAGGNMRTAIAASFVVVYFGSTAAVEIADRKGHRSHDTEAGMTAETPAPTDRSAPS
jgi:hypothetical protein